jgi:hypothetical protein
MLTAICIIGVFFMTETYKKTILQRRARKLNLPITEAPRPASMKTLLMVTVFRPLHMLLTEPIVGFLSLYVAFNFGVLYIFFTAFPFVFGSVYHFSNGETGLVFLGIGLGCVLSVVTIWVTDRLTYRKRHVKASQGEHQGAIAPEHRLYAAMMGSFGLPLGLFWFAWTARSDVHWISPVLATIPFAWGNLCIFVSFQLQPHPRFFS